VTTIKTSTKNKSRSESKILRGFFRFEKKLRQLSQNFCKNKTIVLKIIFSGFLEVARYYTRLISSLAAWNLARLDD
jgi:hypothetical protein